MQACGKRRELVAENKELRKLLRHADRELAMYDPVEFLLSDAIQKWNDGAALDEYSEFFVAYVGIVEGRAIAVSRGKMSTIRQHNTVRSNALRGALRGVAGPGT